LAILGGFWQFQVAFCNPKLLKIPGGFGSAGGFGNPGGFAISGGFGNSGARSGSLHPQ
jgi:hypothetical protein